MYKTLSNKNKVIIASAGSGKTTHIVEQALSVSNKKVLITTYTNENLEQINSYLIKKNGYIPKNITVMSWFSFLLQDGVRPYQSLLTPRDRIKTIIFDKIPASLRYIQKSSVDKYFFTKNNNIYRDRVAEFACLSNDGSQGLVIQRLQKIYDHIFIDEFQDFSGYDLNYLEKLLNSSISIDAVGDPRQATFSTNNSLKNKQYKKSKIIIWIEKMKKAKLLSVEEKNDCHRCNQQICDFADMLFPTLSKTNSCNTEVTGHDGIFCICRNKVSDYVTKYHPIILRYNKNTNTMNFPANNIGSSKGRTYDRVLIFPTQPMINYLYSKDLSKAGDISKLYVAITRAKYSVAFVIEKK